MHRLGFRLWLALSLFIPTAGHGLGAEPFQYKEGNYAKGSTSKLTYLNGVPVLILDGSPEDMGKQTGVLAVRQAKRLYEFPANTSATTYEPEKVRRADPKLSAAQVDAQVKDAEGKLWPVVEKVAAGLEASFPKSQLTELEALIKAGEVDRLQLTSANGMFDLGNAPIGCSSVIIPAHSDTGGLLFGRNLDFSHLGFLHEYSLLMVYRSNVSGRHSFVSAGFPGFVGCFTGMNDAGLTIASHEVFDPNTKTPFNPKGVPFAMAYRRVLEECKTIDEAVKLLQGMARASVTSLVIADVNEGAVIEVSPGSVVLRRFENKPGVCTNHFCSEAMKNPKQTDTFDTLKRFTTLSNSVAKLGDKLKVADVQKRLDSAAMRDLTIQTFVFEPKERRVHLRFGDGKESATRGELVTLDLNPLWAK